MRNEELILKNLVKNDEYGRKVSPFLYQEYFSESHEKVLYNLITEYYDKFNSQPSIEALKINLQNSTGINQYDFENCTKLIDSFSGEYSLPNTKWLLETTEKFCKDKAILNAIMSSINIIDGNDKQFSVDHIPELLSKALAISFEQDIGHDWFDNADKRYDFYHMEEKRIPFEIDILNKITHGGLPTKSLTVLVAGTGQGKSSILCDWAAANARRGYNVLYISLEMAEERIGERLDANMLQVTFNELKSLEKNSYLTKIAKLRKKHQGNLILKEYPSGGAHAGHIANLIEDLRTKKNFVPDVIYIDYLGIMASQRFKANANVNSYNYLKSISEEVRAIGQRFDLPVVTAVQTNRSGNNNSDVEMDNIADSYGINYTADYIFYLFASEEMKSLNQLLFKKLKDRYGDLEYYKRFLVGFDRSKMRCYNLEQPNGNIHMPDTKTDLDNEKPSFSNFSNWS
jgi:replicative DNA helicase